MVGITGGVCVTAIPGRVSACSASSEPLLGLGFDIVKLRCGFAGVFVGDG